MHHQSPALVAPHTGLPGDSLPSPCHLPQRCNSCHLSSSRGPTSSGNFYPNSCGTTLHPGPQTYTHLNRRLNLELNTGLHLDPWRKLCRLCSGTCSSHRIQRVGLQSQDLHQVANRVAVGRSVEHVYSHLAGKWRRSMLTFLQTATGFYNEQI